MQSLQGQIAGFHFLILFLKTLKLGNFFATIRKNVPGDWTKVEYTFDPVKWRANKRSGKLKIKSQIVTVTIFCVKILLTTGGDSTLLTLYISVTRHWIFLSWMETELSSLYIAHKHLHVACFFFLFVVRLCYIQISWQ